MSSYPYEAKQRVLELIEVLELWVDCDPQHEVRGIAVPVVEAGFEAVRAALPDDELRELVGPCARELENGERVRCVDVLHVAEQLDAAIGDPPFRRAGDQH